jgi:alpha-mannosidase
MSSPAEFFADLKAQGLPRERYVGELYFQAHRGTYTSQAKTKRGNRKSEYALREAEIWGSLARLAAGFDFRPQTLLPVWRAVLLNQFHDILPGSSIHRVYEEAEASYAEAISTAESSTASALDALASQEEGQTVFNSLSWARRALIQRPEGPLEVDVPACGWAAVTERTSFDHASPAAVSISVDGFLLENGLIRARFDSLGRLLSLWDLESDREVMSGPGNDLCLFKDVPTRWDAWDVDSMTESLPVPCEDPAEISLDQDHPLVVGVRVKRKLNRSILEQVIRLRRGSRRIDFDTVVDWHESHKLLKVRFPVDIHSTEAISEIQFGHLRRPNHSSRQYDLDRFEICNHKWTALAEEGRGAAVLNDSKYGLSVKGKSINLTLLKSALAPDMTADKGTQVFCYSFYSWNGSLLESGVVREAYDLNIPVQVVQGKCQPSSGSFLSLDRENIVVETIKPAEDGSGDLIVRLYESMRTATRCTLTTFRPIRTAAQTNMLEEEQHDLECSGPTLRLDFRPFEIKTVRLRLWVSL